MAVYIVESAGIRAAQLIEDLPANIQAATRMAINDTADRGRTMIARGVLQQVNFPASYLNPSQDRLVVTKRATDQSLMATITGRDRPTSLARFVQGSVGGAKKAGVAVSVSARAGAKYMRRAFLVRLRRGSADINTKNNMGLAIRLKPGESIQNKNVTLMKKSGLYLLYGPSVNQVMGGQNGVASEVQPRLVTMLESRFEYHLGRLER